MSGVCWSELYCWNNSDYSPNKHPQSPHATYNAVKSCLRDIGLFKYNRATQIIHWRFNRIFSTERQVNVSKTNTSNQVMCPTVLLKYKNTILISCMVGGGAVGILITWCVIRTLPPLGGSLTSLGVLKGHGLFFSPFNTLIASFFFQFE